MFYFHSQEGRTVGTVVLLASTCEFADSTVLSRVSILMRDTDIANLSVRPSVLDVPVSDANGLTYFVIVFFTIR